MLKVRIIPTVLWKDLGVVKGEKFDSWRRVGTILPAIKVYNQRQVDELVVLDITASLRNDEPDYATVNDFSAECFMPLTIGGGVSKIEHIRNLLKAGADKVSINTAAYENTQLISDGAKYFGSQCIVVSIDVKLDKLGNYHCCKKSGTVNTGIDVVSWAREVESLGAGEILLNSVERDGTMSGFDLELIKMVSNAVNIPVIAAGGARNEEDFYLALNEGGAHAVSAASIFHFTEITPLQVKKYLKGKGINVRIELNK